MQAHKICRQCRWLNGIIHLWHQLPSNFLLWTYINVSWKITSETLIIVVHLGCYIWQAAFEGLISTDQMHFLIWLVAMAAQLNAVHCGISLPKLEVCWETRNVAGAIYPCYLLLISTWISCIHQGPINWCVLRNSPTTQQSCSGMEEKLYKVCVMQKNNFKSNWLETICLCLLSKNFYWIILFRKTHMQLAVK